MDREHGGVGDGGGGGRGGVGGRGVAEVWLLRGRDGGARPNYKTCQ